MAILQNRRTVFTLSNTEVMSNSAPTTEAGITKSEGHDGFFIYSDKAFTLWFKDQGGSWNSFNTYELADLTDGVAFSWNNNTAAFIETNEVSHSIAVFIIETKAVGEFRNLDNKIINEAGLNRLDVHSNYKRVRMQNSGHTGEAYAIAIFDENGEAAYVSAPPSGQREGKALGWDENGNLGWITLAAAVSLPEPYLYLDGSSATPQIGNPSDVINLGSAALVTNNGKYDLKSFSFGTSGNKAPIRLNNLDLSSGVYTFSLWFYNKRGGSDWASVLRQTSGGNPNNTANYPIFIRNTDNYLGMMKREGSSNNFYSTGYDMSSFEGLQEWSHLVVVADGVNSTFYVNGQQAGSSVAKVITTSVGEIGAYDGLDTQVFAEALDEIAYWGSALTADHVASIYNSSDKLNAIVTISANLEEYGNATLTDGVLELDGDGDYAVYNGPFRYTDQFSISVWFKSQGSPTDIMVICSNHDGGGVANGNVFSLDTNGTLRIKTQDSGTGTNGDALGVGSNLNDNNWHQLVVTWQASTTNGRKIYIDGQLVHQNTSGASNAWRTDSGSKTYIGGIWNYVTNSFIESGWWNGQIANFSLTNSITTAQEVADDYNAGAPEEQPSSALPELEEDASATFYGNATLTNGILELDGNGDYVELSNSTDYDREDGDLTVSFWFKPDSLPSSNNNFRIISKLYPWDGWMITLSTQNDDDANAMTNGGIAVYQSSTGSGQDRNNRKAPVGGVTLNTWHHVAVVFTSSGDNKIYYDGSLLHSFTPVSRATTTTSPLRLGTGIIDPNSTLGKFFDGKLDKVTIQKTAATSQEIAAVYNAGAPE